MPELLLLSTSLLGAVSAAAQTSDSEQGGLAEIVVTAQKRSEKLQDVPIAVSAITADALESKGVAGVVDLQQVVPNLNISNSNGVVNTSLRGIGSNAIAPGFENSVATYIDGVYIASQIASFINLSNISQIAVLKGPQGTLFGRNATGGVLQITTRQPSDQLVAEGTLSYGNYETASATAYVSGGLTPNLKADFAFYGTTQGEGWGESITTGHDLYRTKHDMTARSKWVWTPSDTTKITLIGDYSDSSNTIDALTPLPGTVSGYEPAKGPQPDLGYNNTSDIANYMKGWAKGGTLILDQGIGSLSLTSISAYRQSEYESLFDFDGSNATPGDFGSYTWPDKQFSQELQLQSAATGRFKWTVGAYYYFGKTAYEPLLITLNTAGLHFDIVDRLRTESIASFAQGTYAIADDTNLTLGVRYTHETREVYDGTTGLTVIPFGISLGTIPAPDDEVKFNKFTYRAALDHRFSDQVLGYVSYNRGFKSGGFNLSNPGTPAYKPETLDSYEVGLKTDLFERRMRLNVAGFYNKYNQVQSQVQDTTRGGVIIIVNAAKATTYGLDMDLQAEVTSNFELTGGLGLLSAKYDSYPNAVFGTPQGGTPVTFGSAKGNHLPLSSPFTANLGFNYRVPLANGQLCFSPNLYFNDGQYFESDNIIKQSSYAQVNATLNWVSSGEHLSLAVFGKNLTDKRVLTFEAVTPNGTHQGNYGAPRTYGVTVGYKF